LLPSTTSAASVIPEVVQLLETKYVFDYTKVHSLEHSSTTQDWEHSKISSDLATLRPSVMNSDLVKLETVSATYPNLYFSGEMHMQDMGKSQRPIYVELFFTQTPLKLISTVLSLTEHFYDPIDDFNKRSRTYAFRPRYKERIVRFCLDLMQAAKSEGFALTRSQVDLPLFSFDEINQVFDPNLEVAKDFPQDILVGIKSELVEHQTWFDSQSTLRVYLREGFLFYDTLHSEEDKHKEKEARSERVKELLARMQANKLQS
jgi:hypothetical protein